MSNYWNSVAFVLQCVYLLSCAVCISTGLYFHIGETERKCFIEDIPDETMVVGKYKVEVFDKTQHQYVPTTGGLGMHVEVRDPDDKTIMSRMYAMEGRFTFTSASAGEHIICIHSNSTSWFSSGQLRVHLSIQVGENANDYQEIAARDKLSELQLRIRQLLDQVEQISKEQNYQRMQSGILAEFLCSKFKCFPDFCLSCVAWLLIYYREERFRETSESTNQRVLWWAIAQTVILVVTGLWQMKHLKGFFEAKKLV